MSRRLKVATNRRGKPRPFLAYDGEGVGNRYVLLARTDDYIYSPVGLTTEQCLAFLSRTVRHNPVRVFFAFGYDIAHIVRDLPPDKLEALYHNQDVDYKQYTLHLIPKKIFKVSSPGHSFAYYDVWSFFATSFVKACLSHLGNCDERIQSGKDARADFSQWSEPRLVEYNQLECVYLERLMYHLRDILSAEFEGLPSLLPRSWYGPGAIANNLLRGVSAGQHVFPEKSYPHKLTDPLSRAYFGGRIESFLVGSVHGNIYRYDIRSAYPAAMRYIPRLTWKWRKVYEIDKVNWFGLYRLVWDESCALECIEQPGLLPFRTANGRIYYPASGEGWYWYPEAHAALSLSDNVKVLEGYVMDAPYIFPLRDVVERMYTLRAILKGAKDAREYPLKIGLNSLYGKTAQRVGSARYHSMCWAGFITSYTRAAILKAIRQKPYNIIATLTDGILTDAPLDLPLSDQMGDWEMDYYTDCLMLLPGVYRLTNQRSGKVVEKWRGYNVKELDWESVIDTLGQGRDAVIPSPTFVGHLLANHMPTAYGTHRLEFINVDRTLQPFHMQKRQWHVKINGQHFYPPDLGEYAVRSRQHLTVPNSETCLSAPYDAFLGEFSREQLLEREASEEYIEL